MKIINCKLKIFPLASVIFVLGILMLPSQTHAGFLLNRPIFLGLQEGLVGYWSFDGPDMNKLKAIDRSGQGNDGTLTNGPVRVAGKIGQALEFDGVNDYVDIGTGPSSVNSVSFWVYPKTTTEYFVNLTGTTDYIWVDAGTITATGVTSPTIYVNGVVSSALSANQWQHVTVTTGTAENASNFDIGRTADLNNMDGLIDDVRVYNRTLSSDEIKRLYRIGATLKLGKASNTGSLTEGLVGYWSFDGPDMNKLKAVDRSGQGNNGTLTNGPIRVAGKIGQALEFDGVNDFVDVGSPASLTNLGAVTISAWIKPTSIKNPSSGIVMKARGLDGDFEGWSFFAHNESGGAADLVFDAQFSVTSLKTSTVYNTIVNGQWQHVVVAWDGSTTAANVRFYRNGVEIAQGGSQANSNGSGTRNDDSIRSLLIASPNVVGGFLPGQIDDVRVYNRVLSADEIKRLYNMGK